MTAAFFSKRPFDPFSLYLPFGIIRRIALPMMLNVTEKSESNWMSVQSGLLVMDKPVTGQDGDLSGIKS